MNISVKKFYWIIGPLGVHSFIFLSVISLQILPISPSVASQHLITVVLQYNNIGRCQRVEARRDKERQLQIWQVFQQPLQGNQQCQNYQAILSSFLCITRFGRQNYLQSRIVYQPWTFLTSSIFHKLNLFAQIKTRDY